LHTSTPPPQSVTPPAQVAKPQSAAPLQSSRHADSLVQWIWPQSPASRHSISQSLSPAQVSPQVPAREQSTLH
jgi:hypothetical protein